MLPHFFSILLAILILAVFAIGQDFAPPEILAADPDSLLEPLAGRPVHVDEAVDELKVIRGLLGRRQLSCSSNYFACGSGSVQCMAP
jgi:hypothetical protein